MNLVKPINKVACRVDRMYTANDAIWNCAYGTVRKKTDWAVLGISAYVVLNILHLNSRIIEHDRRLDECMSEFQEESVLFK
jgi:hypothetical protein